MSHQQKRRGSFRNRKWIKSIKNNCGVKFTIVLIAFRKISNQTSYNDNVLKTSIAYMILKFDSNYSLENSWWQITLYPKINCLDYYMPNMINVVASNNHSEASSCKLHYTLIDDLQWLRKSGLITNSGVAFNIFGIFLISFKLHKAVTSFKAT